MTTTQPLTDLRQVPGVGPSIERDLRSIGITQIADLRGQTPEALYDRLCAVKGARVDRCVLYVFRTAVYYATTADRDPELLNWWHWKDP